MMEPRVSSQGLGSTPLKVAGQVAGCVIVMSVVTSHGHRGRKCLHKLPDVIWGLGGGAAHLPQQECPLTPVRLLVACSALGEPDSDIGGDL